MEKKINVRGFTIAEVVIAIAVFLIFAVGIYSGITYALKGVYHSRLRIIETAIISDELELIKNMSYNNIGVVSGVPAGTLLANKILNKNGLIFSVTTTVRYVDDGFDGYASTTDLTPNDYKFIEIAANCVNCLQQKPLTASTHVIPNVFVTSTEHGSLFVNVVDANGLPVPQATVRVVNVSTTPAIDLTDTTRNDGWYGLVSTPTGTLAYNIVVSKGGYSTDFTTSSSAVNPNPTKSPASVRSFETTNITFMIDLLGTLNLRTINNACNVVPSANFNLRGAKQIGNAPLVYKYDKNITTNGSGEYTLSGAEWDTYYVNALGIAYDLAGTIPISPFNLLPGSTQDVSIILQPHTPNSLLVKVKDAGTGLPISGASVGLTGPGTMSMLTGLGYAIQTDWSEGLLGGGQIFFTGNEKKYFSESNTNGYSAPGDITLRSLGTVPATYPLNGELESPVFDLGSAVNFNNITFNPTSQPVGAGINPVELQLATSNSSTPTEWEFVGPDGTEGTYFTATSTVIHSSSNGRRYAKYKLYLKTDDINVTPVVSEVSFTYTSSCFAPGQAFFSNITSGDYTLQVSKAGYTGSTSTFNITGNLIKEINLSP